MPVAQQDQWQQQSAQAGDGSISRLETALARIAAAAGRKQDELREFELTARAAQHEADLLIRAQQEAALARPETGPDEVRSMAAELDALIATIRAATTPAAGSPATGPDMSDGS